MAWSLKRTDSLGSHCVLLPYLPPLCLPNVRTDQSCNDFCYGCGRTALPGEMWCLECYLDRCIHCGRVIWCCDCYEEIYGEPPCQD